MTFRVSTLPGVRIQAPAGEVTALAGRRLPLALLVHLAVERSASRDTLLGLLWPERDEERARHSLSQAVHDLRRALGTGTLVVKGDVVSLDPRVETDAAHFEEAVEGGRWAEALDLYGGAFLEGVHLAETHGFEDWVDRRRAQLARLHRKARRERLAACLGVGDTAGALSVAQRWAELEPLEDEAQQQTIELLARLGHRTEALRQFESFKEALRREDLEPMEELEALAAKIAAGDTLSLPSVRPARSLDSAPQAVPVPTPAAELRPARATASTRRPAEEATVPGVGAAMSEPQSLGPSNDGAPSSSSPVALLVRQLLSRRVLQTAGLYLVGAWAVVQVAATVQGPLDLPPIAVTVVILVAIAGFPTTCILAWAYDLGPPRLRRTGPVEGGSARARSRVAALLVLLAALTFVLAGGAGWLVWLRHTRSGPAAAPGLGGMGTGALRPDHIAVLEFQDLSPPRDKGYLAGALTESLIDQLTKVEALKVRSREAVRAYADGRLPLDSIGRALGVGTIVTGTVVAEGERVKVDVDLVDATDGQVVATQSVVHPGGEMIPLVDDAVADVTSMIRRRVGERVRARDWQAGTNDEEAWRLFQSARQMRHDSEKLLSAGNAEGALKILERADSLLARTEGRDTRWIAPLIERAVVEHKIAWVFVSPVRRDMPAAVAAFHRAIGHLDRALAQDSTNSAALELRGKVRYDEAFFTIPAGRAADSLLSIAERDLWDAVGRDTRRALAWAELSSILLGKEQWTGANTTALRAYQEDAFLENAEQVLFDGYRSAFELRDDAGAEQWCAETRRRAPGGWGSATCQLELMAWSKTTRPDVATAWAVRNGAGGFGDEPELIRRYRSLLDLMVAGVLARAGLADSARAVIARVPATIPRDATFILVAAAARVLLNDRAGAIELLREECGANPRLGEKYLRARQFASLRLEPRCAALGADERP